MLGWKKIIYKEPVSGLHKFLPWAMFVAPGVILQKDGLLQKTYCVRGPDLDAASPESIHGVSMSFNSAVKRLGNGWTISAETQSTSVNSYNGSKFYNQAAFLFDYERRLRFKEYGQHYEKYHYFTFVYKLERATISKVKGAITGEQNEEKNASKEIEQFIQTTRDIMGTIADKIVVWEIDDSETLSYLHSSLSFNWFKLRAPECPMFIDRLIADETIETGMSIKVGEYHTRIIGIKDFPMRTYPGIFDAMERAEIEFRWVQRYIALDKEYGLKEIKKVSAKLFGQRKGFKQLVQESMTKESTGREDATAIAQEEQTREAEVDVGNDYIGIGYFTTNIMVWDLDEEIVEEKAKIVKRIINQAGFTAIVETFNATEAFFGMMPGNVYANVRRPMLSSMNYTHIVPLTAIWSGDPINHFFNEIIGDGTPHITCSTRFGTVFNLSLAVGDVMHTFICGPSGAGKSVLLGTLAIQFLRYEGARVVIFDKDRSAKQLTYAVGGTYYEPGTGDLTFQPLEDLESPADMTWATEFIELLLTHQKVVIDADKRSAIANALKDMTGIGKEVRTLTTFQQYVQDQEIKKAVAIYTLSGQYGQIFDSNEGGMHTTDWTMIEMARLMELGAAAVEPGLMYMFKEVEKKFDIRHPTALLLDEAWLFLRNPIFANKIQDWLKTLRKKGVAVIFATQEIADAAKSDILPTILQQCHTKIYLPDEEAISPTMKGYYEGFGLTEGEINLIARAKKKADYFYKSTKGVRLFQLDLGKVELALVTSPNHPLLDTLTPGKEAMHAILKDKLSAEDYEKVKKWLHDNPSMDTRD